MCDPKRQGSQWIGKCRYRLPLGPAFLEDWCTLELDEIVTSVLPHMRRYVSLSK